MKIVNNCFITQLLESVVCRIFRTKAEKHKIAVNFDFDLFLILTEAIAIKHLIKFLKNQNHEINFAAFKVLQRHILGTSMFLVFCSRKLRFEHQLVNVFIYISPEWSHNIHAVNSFG